ncbi:MAG: hypothetical protein IKC05_09080 [Lentisphaeria bacterium]|nr:hypothetical protein [Lentisphaeria bacterium]
MKKLLVWLLAAATCVLSAQVRPAASEIVLDGKLDDAAWKKAVVHSDFRPFANSGKNRLKSKTSFMVLHRDGDLYIGIRCDEPFMNKLKAPKGGGAMWNMDGVEIFMAPTGQSDEFYQFLVTASNIRWSQWYGEAGVIRPDPYAPLWESKVFHGKNFWSVEAKFPLSGFYMTRNQNWRSKWLFNITRNRYPVKEEYTWSPMRYSSHESKLFRSLDGFPKRNASADVYIKSVVPESVTAMGNEFRATSVFEIQSSAAASGSYSMAVTAPGCKTTRQYVKLVSGLNKISVPNTVYGSAGKNQTKIVLSGPHGTFGRFYPVTIVYSPVAIKLEQPNYSNVFYPDQDHSKVKGYVTVTLAKKADAVIKIKGDGVPEKKLIFKQVNGKVPFEFATPEMAYGSSVITAEVFDGKKKIASTSVKIRRPRPPKGDWYRIENGVLLKNGKPYFPRDIYAKYYQGGEAFKKKFNSDNLHLTKFPINILEPFRLLGRSIEPETTKDRKPNAKLFKAIDRKIARPLHKDFVFYYLSDEPECREISPIYLKYLYDYVKEKDPFHPVLVASRASSSFVDCADVFSTHPYPNPFFDTDERKVRLMNTPIHKSREFVSDISNLKRGDKVIGLTPQFFSYGNVTNKLSDYPTFEELECTVWSAIVNGGRLMWAYAYMDMGDRPTLYEGLRYLYGSIETLENILVKGKAVALKSSDKMLEGVLIRNGKEELLILCNVSAKALKGTLTSSTAFSAMTEFRGSRKLPAGKVITRTFKPYEVLIFSSTPVKGMKTRAEVLREIGNMEKSRGLRGNVLFGKGEKIEIDSSNPARRNNLVQQNKLFDGTLDVLAWNHYGRRTKKDAWLEMCFPKFVPTFGKIRLFGYNMADVSVKIWKFGEWKNIDVKPVKCGKNGLEWRLVKPQRTVKVRFDFPGSAKRDFIEVYEVELVK